MDKLKKRGTRKPLSEETKRKIREKAKNNWSNPEYKAKFEEGYSKVRPKMKAIAQANAEKISAGQKASWTEERREQASKTYKESWASDKERKEKQSKRLISSWKNEEFKQKTSAAISNSLSSKENKEKVSSRALNLWQDPKHRELMSSKIKKAWKSKEYRDKVIKPSIEETQPQIIEAIIQDLKDKKGSVSFLCNKYGLNSHTHVFNSLRKSGLHSLIEDNQTQSSPQLEIFNFIKDCYNGEILLNTRKIISPKELDIYIPEKNFAIEYNGLYWHSSAAKNYKRNKHYIKSSLCQKNNINLLAVYEDEWSSKKDLIKSMILHRLGLSTANKLYAKNLLIVEVDAKTCKEFHDLYHLDGGLKYKGYGLKLGEELVAVLSLRKFSQTPYKGATEIARFAVNTKYIVIGAFGKLISKIAGTIVSYSNNRLSNGNVYKQLGFIEDTVAKTPSYWYTDFSSRVFRTKCKRINNPEIISIYPTEELQALNGVFSQKLFGDSRPLYRIEDYGHRRWVLKR